jgi:hypothetical protein
VKQIATDLRASRQLDDQVAGKDRSQLHATIVSSAKNSNPEIRASNAATRATWDVKPENRAAKAERDAIRGAIRADEQATQYQTSHDIGPLPIGDPEKNAQSVKDEEQILSFSDPNANLARG